MILIVGYHYFSVETIARCYSPAVRPGQGQIIRRSRPRGKTDWTLGNTG